MDSTSEVLFFQEALSGRGGGRGRGKAAGTAAGERDRKTNKRRLEVRSQNKDYLEGTMYEHTGSVN